MVETASLLEEKDQIIIELCDLRKVACEFGITGNRKYYARGSISKELWDAYKANSMKILGAEKRLREINAAIKNGNLNNQQCEYDLFKSIVRDALSKDDYLSIIREKNRREAGEPPLKVTISRVDVSGLRSKYDTVKSIAINALDALKKTREVINRYISDNEPQINKADYLQKVSNLNKGCPPLSEIADLNKKIRLL